MNARPPAPIRPTDRRRQRGMTLLELLVVVALMSAVGFMALSQVGDDLGQARYQDTENRLETIRKAIIGDTSRTLNGQPEIRGFVSDMGRLPVNLTELLKREYCENDRKVKTEADCNAIPGGNWISLPDSRIDDATTGFGTGLRVGWNGPYLIATADENEASVYRDGWGNDDGTHNFGWRFDPLVPPPAPYDLIVQSYGMDGTAGGSNYEEDYPAGVLETLVYNNEYRLSIQGITIDFGNPIPYCTTPSYEREASCTNTNKGNGKWIPAPMCSDPEITKKNDCEAADETWIIIEPKCTVGLSAACAEIGGNWNANGSTCTASSSPPCDTGTTSCSFDQTALCAKVGGSWLDEENYCFFDKLDTEYSCEKAERHWAWPNVPLCARLFTPEENTGVIDGLDIDDNAIPTTDSITILMDGQHRSGRFTFTNETALTQGVRAVGVYWYDTKKGDCSKALLPAMVAPRHYSFIARSALQAISWPLN